MPVPSGSYILETRRRPDRFAYYLRVLRLVATIEFRMKYADSLLGYAWSLAKPLAYFAVLWLVFSRLFNARTPVESFALYLIIGLVFYLFFIDAVGAALTSVVARGSLLRRLAFSPLVLPLAVVASACLTLMVNLTAVALFAVGSQVWPDPEWLLVVPLLIEFLIFVVGIGLIVATLFVRFQDIAQIWELVAQLMIFITPVMYPLSILPGWMEKVLFLNPLVQVMQDVRAVVLEGEVATVTDVLGAGGRVVPVAVALGVFVFGLFIFRRDSSRFAERV
jgi:ABC-2 type transport system permease protein